MANLMMLLANLGGSEAVNVSRRGFMPLSKAFNYLLIGHHLQSVNHLSILLSKNDDESFYLRREHDVSSLEHHGACILQKDKDIKGLDKAFIEQFEQLDAIYKATDLTLPPNIMVHVDDYMMAPSQRRSEYTLDRGDILLSHTLDRHNLRDRDASLGAHLDFLRITAGFSAGPAPATYPSYPSPPHVPDAWMAAKCPSARRTALEVSMMCNPQSETATVRQARRGRTARSLPHTRAAEANADATVASVAGPAPELRAQARPFKPRAGIVQLGSAALLPGSWSDAEGEGKK
ncbi:MAG: hypothetical protein M1822_009845 [Bathelium mastoideum]|nr:MAG: hypothetical protein M1822_009845 [Bathelium mastoideum]